MLPSVTHSGEPLLELVDLKVHLHADRGIVRAVDGVSMSVMPEERVALVGESGSGKSVTARSILRLIPDSNIAYMSGRAIYDQRSVLDLDDRALRELRGREIGMVFQDPMTYMNPTKRVSGHLAEAVRRSTHRTSIAGDPDACLRAVGLDPSRVSSKYPHELSGGMRQRVLIAMALCCGPRVLIADEPTTAVDVTVQAQILQTLRDLTSEFGISLLLITHDLGIVAELCDRVYVMYAGQIVDAGTVDAFFADPKHPYSRGLLKSLPRIGGAKGQFSHIPGFVPDLAFEDVGCRFRDRCDRRFFKCDQDPPLFHAPGMAVRCWLYESSNGEPADRRYEVAERGGERPAGS